MALPFKSSILFIIVGCLNRKYNPFFGDKIALFYFFGHKGIDLYDFCLHKSKKSKTMSVVITCPDFCTVAVPEVNFSACSPVVREGEISKLYIANPEEPISDWTDPAAWSARIDNDNPATSAIRELTVIGDMVAPESTVLKISARRTYQGLKSRTINFEIDDLSFENIDAARQFDCGGTFLVWFETYDGLLVGGPTGILGTINLDWIIPRERTEFQKLVGTIKWDDKIGPMAIDSPIA